MRKIISIVFMLLLPLQTLAAQDIDHYESDHASFEMQSEVSSVAKGDSFWLTITVTPKQGWQHFWKNSGSIGASPKLTWSDTHGIIIGDAQFPAPSIISVSGSEAYGYTGAINVLVPVEVSENYDFEVIDINFSVDWGFCNTTCQTDNVPLSLSLPIGETVYSPQAENTFSQARARLPNTSYWSAEMQSDNDEMLLLIHMSEDEMATIGVAEFYPNSDGVLHYGAEQKSTKGQGGLLIRSGRDAITPMATDLSGILAIKDKSGKTAYYVQDADPSALLKNLMPVEQIEMSVFELILFAVLGGIILNLMPCVFPVLSLKALALLRSHKSHKGEGWAYTAGILTSFGLIGSIILFIRAGGETIGWGFQLQEPLFVAAMVFILVAVGLSLSGLFTMRLGIEGAGQSLTESNGMKGSFFTGVLAALVATPCTAPFMASAIGYAITQPSYITMLGFLSLGFGLALPFLLLSYFPILSKILPKPGAWMEKIKEALAFPMYITAAWLIWVFTNQVGSDAALMLLIGIVLFAFAIWLWQQSPSKLVHIGSIIFIISAFVLAMPPSNDTANTDILDGEPYSDARLNELRNDGRRVFVYFSADWCITCKVNEQVSLYREENRKLVTDRNIAILKGDWTNRNETIAKVLARHNRMGVPLYLYYASGADKPIILPEILTPNSLTDIFRDK